MKGSNESKKNILCTRQKINKHYIGCIFVISTNGTTIYSCVCSIKYILYFRNLKPLLLRFLPLVEMTPNIFCYVQRKIVNFFLRLFFYSKSNEIRP
jgi:hypothetical protein